jgi:hypothetical protein
LDHQSANRVNRNIEQTPKGKGNDMTQNMIELIKNLAISGEEAYLFNVYKGIPLSFPAKIVEIGDSSLKVLTDSYQTLCMYMEKRTYIQSQALPEVLQAEVIELDSLERLAVLANFSPAESGIGRRMQVRIPPRNPMEGNIQDQEENYVVRGELADISPNGAAIYLPAGIFSVEQFHKGAVVTISLTLPGEFTTGMPAAAEAQLDHSSDDPFTRETRRVAAVSGQGPEPDSTQPNAAGLQHVVDPDLSIEAEVAYLHAEEFHNRYRIGVRFMPGEAARSLISQFIVQRQAEIVHEIKVMYELLADIAEK